MSEQLNLHKNELIRELSRLSGAVQDARRELAKLREQRESFLDDRLEQERRRLEEVRRATEELREAMRMAFGVIGNVITEVRAFADEKRCTTASFEEWGRRLREVMAQHESRYQKEMDALSQAKRRLEDEQKNLLESWKLLEEEREKLPKTPPNITVGLSAN